MTSVVVMGVAVVTPRQAETQGGSCSLPSVVFSQLLFSADTSRPISSATLQAYIDHKLRVQVRLGLLWPFGAVVTPAQCYSYVVGYRHCDTAFSVLL